MVKKKLFALTTSQIVSTMCWISSMCVRFWRISIIFDDNRWHHLWLFLLPSKMVLMNSFSIPKNKPICKVLLLWIYTILLLALDEIINKSMTIAWTHIFSSICIDHLYANMCYITLFSTVELETWQDCLGWFSLVLRTWSEFQCAHTIICSYGGNNELKW